MSNITRTRFLKLLVAGSGGLFGLSAFGAAKLDDLRGDRVGWARLKTPSPDWKRHAGADPMLTTFFHEQTTLNIDKVWYEADANDLDALCHYPLLFSQGLAPVVDPAGRKNIAEYIRRGGFMLVDACHDIHVTPDFDQFLRDQNAFYAAILPEAKIVDIPPTHDIYKIYFQFPDGKPPHTFMSDVYDPAKAAHGLYAVMIGKRMAGLISVCGWQCGWDHVTEHSSMSPEGTDIICMRMVANIYIYAMTQTG
ncbi:MAG TPA: DUF4159 domain-containing protein [Chthoniobacteraceae bacterium]|nr:DUF4159 domain-containing protein [Chthoniobacteraceae bacterium]